MSDLTTGRFSAALTDAEQPLPAVENDRPVANRETSSDDRNDSAQAVTYMEALLEGANPDEGFYE